MRGGLEHLCRGRLKGEVRGSKPPKVAPGERKQLLRDCAYVERGGIAA
jgi:hypothetical protein